MSTISTRLLVGFLAGLLSHWIVEGSLGAIFYASNLVPNLPWSLRPVPPFGVPQTLSLAFWAGLWGVAYALLEPRLTGLFGRWRGALVFGLFLPLLGDWFIALPLKGHGVAGGFHPATVSIDIALNAALGVGIVAIFWLVLVLNARRSPASSQALQG